LGSRYAVGLAFGLSLVSSIIFLAVGGFTVGWRAALLISGLGLVSLLIILGLLFVWLGRRIGGLTYGTYDLFITLTDRVRSNFFGICNGRKESQIQDSNEVLTDWLSAKLDDLAGLKDSALSVEAKRAPLTFRHLWGTDDPKREKKVDLRMVASNLSQNQPYILPFERNLFLFKRQDFEKLFPEHVVSHMTQKARPYKGFRLPAASTETDSFEYYFLPEAKDLPVIVATRMSLSFPLLISMVPLYTISQDAFEKKVRFDFEQIEELGEWKECIVLKQRDETGQWIEPKSDQWKTIDQESLKPSWFSDGGICSNFPIHFFDAWLPRRPTFGVNLTSQLANEPSQEPSKIGEAVRRHSSYAAQQANVETHLDAKESAANNRDVYLPKPDSEVSPEWIPIPGLAKFFESIFRTAQNYRDNMQAMLPSYRERIVQIRLTDKEGGLNLDMPPEVIDSVFQKGQKAGEVLLDEFDFPQHQWVRFRVLMKQIEASLDQMDQVISKHQIYQGLASRQIDVRGYPYPCDTDWMGQAATRLQRMSEEIKSWMPPDLFTSAKNPPLPEPKLRVTPEF
jgi:Patatin-like phospholipase